MCFSYSRHSIPDLPQETASVLAREELEEDALQALSPTGIFARLASRVLAIEAGLREDEGRCEEFAAACPQ